MFFKILFLLYKDNDDRLRSSQIADRSIKKIGWNKAYEQQKTHTNSGRFSS